MPVSFPSLQLIFALLLLTPGFITLTLIKKRGKITRSFDRFDKTIYTVIASGVSLSIIIVAFSLSNSQEISETISTNYPIWQLSVGFLSACIISALIGYGLGYVIDEKIYKGVNNRKETTWQLVFNNSEEPREVRVVTTAGSEIHGYIYVNDTAPDGQDLLLRYPQKILREETGEIQSKTSIGEYTFVSQADVSHIYFESNINI
jgi:uncharacterized integral membrane protein